MAVYTHIPDAALHAHLALYNLGALQASAGIGEGVSNTNYLLVTAAGKFILTVFEGRVQEADLPFFFDYMAHLEGKGLPVARPVPDRQGRIVLPLMGKPSALTTFLEGTWPRAPTPAHGAQMGGALARMHQAGQDFRQGRENGMALPEWRRLIDLCAARAEGVEPGLAAFLQAELDFLEKNLPSGLPRGAVHADLFPDNVFFQGDKLSGIIDFYFACTETLAYDLMLTVNAWAFDAKGVADPQKIAALLQAYNEARPLTAEERRALPLFGRAAALRITATRLYDLLHPAPGAVVTPKNPLAHVNILRFYHSTQGPLLSP